MPPLKIGNIFACFSWDGNWPVAKLLLISAAIDGDKQLTASLGILGPSPSSPVPLEESNLLI